MPNKKKITAKALETKNVATFSGISLQEQLFETYTFKYGCRHGAPDDVDVINRLPILDGHEDVRNEAIAQVDRQTGASTNRQDFTVHYATAIHAAESKYWKENARYIDQPMVQLLYAMATEEILDGDENITRVRRLNKRALEFQAKLENPNIDDQGIYDLLSRDVYEARTDRGLKIQLAGKIPCECLDETRAGARLEPRTRKCDYCKRQDTQDIFKKCSRCKVACYCTKDCQVKGWKNHKLICNKGVASLLKKK